jgi:hypothetical protein
MMAAHEMVPLITLPVTRPATTVTVTRSAPEEAPQVLIGGHKSRHTVSTILEGGRYTGPATLIN